MSYLRPTRLSVTMRHKKTSGQHISHGGITSDVSVLVHLALLSHSYTPPNITLHINNWGYRNKKSTGYQQEGVCIDIFLLVQTHSAQVVNKRFDNSSSYGNLAREKGKEKRMLVHVLVLVISVTEIAVWVIGTYKIIRNKKLGELLTGPNRYLFAAWCFALLLGLSATWLSSSALLNDVFGR